MNSQDLKKLRKGKNTERVWALLVKIQGNGNTIYRKAIGFRSMKKNQIGLEYRSRKILGFDSDEGKNKEVATIERTWWFPYCWHHYNSIVRGPFRVAVFALGLTIITEIIQFLFQYI